MNRRVLLVDDEQAVLDSTRLLTELLSVTPDTAVKGRNHELFEFR